jgi:serine/threonine-protein kinase
MEDTLDRLKAALADRYTIERELGRGGMATVYLARDHRHERSVALKVLRSDLGASIGPERFQREIKVAAHLQHPHIVPVHDSGEAAGQLWYTMPFVEGESLRERLSRERHVSLEDAVQIALEVADALVHAHRNGVIHRDIKPENIMLSDGHAVVADFGIAATVSTVGSERLTQTGMVFGTPAYMSPEQAAGDQNVDGRSDLYSLGCVLYEMLAGCPPFSGPTAQAIRARHTVDPVPRLRTVRSDVPVALERVVLRALAKVPGDRFANAAEFRKALRRGELERVLPRRSKVLIGLSFLAVAAVLVYWLVARAPSGGDARITGAGATAPLEHQRVAVLYFQPQGSDPDLRLIAGGLTEGLIDSLRRVGPLEVSSAGAVARYRDLPISPDSAARSLDVDVLIVGRVEKSGGRFKVAIWLVEASSGAASVHRELDAAPADLLPIQGELAKEALLMLRGRPRDRSFAWLLLQRGKAALNDEAVSRGRGDTASTNRALQEADSFLASAERSAPTWAEPIVWRAKVAYQHARQAPRDSAFTRGWVDMGLGHAERALALDSGNADAYEIRGTLRYWGYLVALERDSGWAGAGLRAAEADLTRARDLNSRQAGAWATLSHLYGNTGRASDAQHAARMAYEADPYIANAPVILSRLFFGAYDMEQFESAAGTCAEAARRFPGLQSVLQCRMLLLTTPLETPDVGLAWRLADSLTSLASAERRGYWAQYSRLMAAAVVARAGLPDSARRIVERSRHDPAFDPTGQLPMIGAFAYLLAGDTAGAIGLLEVMLRTNEDYRVRFMEDRHWWFRPIADNPAFRRLLRSAR